VGVGVGMKVGVRLHVWILFMGGVLVGGVLNLLHSRFWCGWGSDFVTQLVLVWEGF